MKMKKTRKKEGVSIAFIGIAASFLILNVCIRNSDLEESIKKGEIIQEVEETKEYEPIQETKETEAYGAIQKKEKPIPKNNK